MYTSNTHKNIDSTLAMIFFIPSVLGIATLLPSLYTHLLLLPAERNVVANFFIPPVANFFCKFFLYHQFLALQHCFHLCISTSCYWPLNAMLLQIIPCNRGALHAPFSQPLLHHQSYEKSQSQSSLEEKCKKISSHSPLSTDFTMPFHKFFTVITKQRNE